MSVNESKMRDGEAEKTTLMNKQKKNLEKTESSIYILTLNLKRFFFQVEDLNFFDE